MRVRVRDTLSAVRAKEKERERENSQERVPLVRAGMCKRKVVSGLGIRTAKGSHPFVLR